MRFSTLAGGNRHSSEPYEPQRVILLLVSSNFFILMHWSLNTLSNVRECSFAEQSSGVFHVALFPSTLSYNSSCFGLPWLQVSCPPSQRLCLIFHSVCHSLETLQTAVWDGISLISFVFHLSGITVLSCIMSSVLRIIVSYILSSFIVVSGRRVNLIACTPSWLDMEVLQTVLISCPI